MAVQSKDVTPLVRLSEPNIEDDISPEVAHNITEVRDRATSHHTSLVNFMYIPTTSVQQQNLKKKLLLKGGGANFSSCRVLTLFNMYCTKPTNTIDYYDINIMSVHKF